MINISAGTALDVTAEKNAVIVMAGIVGQSGLNGAMSLYDVETIIDNHVMSIPAEDGISVTNGRIRIDVDSLPQAPV